MLKDLLNAEIEKTERRLDVMNEYPQGHTMDIVELSGYIKGIVYALYMMDVYVNNLRLQNEEWWKINRYELEALTDDPPSA